MSDIQRYLIFRNINCQYSLLENNQCILFLNTYLREGIINRSDYKQVSKAAKEMSEKELSLFNQLNWDVFAFG